MKFLFWFFIGIAVLIPLVSWDGFMFASTFAKAMLFQMGVEVALVIWLWQRGLKRLKQLWQPRSFLFWALLLWLAAMLISSLTAYDPAAAWWSGYERMMGMIMWLHLFVFFTLLAMVMREERQWNMLWIAIALSGTAAALIGVGERFFGSDIYSNVGSTLYNSAFLGSFLVLIFFVVVRSLIKEKRVSLAAIGWFSVLLVVFFAILFTEARSAIAGLAAGGLTISALIAFFGINRPIISMPPRWIRGAAFAAIAVAIIGVGAAIIVKGSALQTSLADRTGSGRLLAWRVGWNAFKERPLFGWGIENFSFAFSAHYDPRLFNVEPWFDRGHNAIVDWGVTTGIVGLLGYLGVMGGSFLALARRREYALAGLLAAAFAQNLFTFDILPTYMILFTVFAYSIHHEIRDEIYEIQSRKILTRLNLVNNLVNMAAVIVIIPIFYFVLWQPLRENMIAKAAGNAFAQGADTRGYQLVRKALSYSTYGDLEVRRLAAEYVFEFIKKGGRREKETMTNLYDFALEKMKENGEVQPGETKWPAYGAALGNLAYAHTGNLGYAERAEAAAAASLALSPGRQQHWLELAQALLAQKKEKEYVEAMDKAIALMPRYPIPHLNAAVGAIILGNREREEQEIVWLRDTTWDIPASQRDSWDNPTRDFEELAQAYYKIKRLADAIVYQERLSEERGKTRDFIQLAALYKEAGRFIEARIVAEKIKIMDPALAGEAENFLHSLGL